MRIDGLGSEKVDVHMRKQWEDEKIVAFARGVGRAELVCFEWGFLCGWLVLIANDVVARQIRKSGRGVAAGFREVEYGN